MSSSASKKRSADWESPQSSKRQTNLSSFLKPKPSPSPAKQLTFIDITTPEPDIVEQTKAIKEEVNDTKEGISDEISLATTSTTPHPYHPPPKPNHNHPHPFPTPTFALQTTSTPRAIVKQDLDLLYFKPFVDPSCSRLLMKYLLENMPWYRVTYTVRGITINTPRYTTVFGKDSTTKSWVGYKIPPRAIPPILLDLMKQVEQVTSEQYNFTLVNYYSEGKDSISYHSDSESFLGPNPCIASLSLGDNRDFYLRHVDHKTNNLPIEKFVLSDGDMVVMRGKTQHKWQHAVPKRSKAQGRINIAFRKAVTRYGTDNYYQYNVGTGPIYRWKGGKMCLE